MNTLGFIWRTLWIALNLAHPHHTLNRLRLDKCKPQNSTILSLDHLLIDSQSQRIYIGGTNCLYQISSDFKVEHIVITGAQEDSVRCSARGSCQQGAEKTLTDNYSKALLLDHVEGVMIVCGSLYQGICERFVRGDIRKKLPTIPVPLVANDPLGKSVVFIGPGLPDARSHRVMYVASPHTREGPYRSQEEIPIVSRYVHPCLRKKAFFWLHVGVLRAKRALSVNLKSESLNLDNSENGTTDICAGFGTSEARSVSRAKGGEPMVCRTAQSFRYSQLGDLESCMVENGTFFRKYLAYRKFALSVCHHISPTKNSYV